MILENINIVFPTLSPCNSSSDIGEFISLGGFDAGSQTLTISAEYNISGCSLTGPVSATIDSSVQVITPLSAAVLEAFTSAFDYGTQDIGTLSFSISGLAPSTYFFGFYGQDSTGEIFKVGPVSGVSIS